MRADLMMLYSSRWLRVEETNERKNYRKQLCAFSCTISRKFRIFEGSFYDPNNLMNILIMMIQILLYIPYLTNIIPPPQCLESALTWVDQSAKDIRAKLLQRTKSFFFFFDNETKEGNERRDCLVRNLEGSVTSRNFNFRREICITGGREPEWREREEVSEPKEAVNLLSLGHFCARTANKKGSRDKTVSPRNFSREILERRRISRGGRISRTRKFGKSSLDSRESGMKNDEEFRIILEEEWSIRIFRRFFLALREKFSDFFFLFYSK